MIQPLFFFKKKILLTFIIVFSLSGILSCGDANLKTETSPENESTSPNNSAVTFDTALSPAPSEDSNISRNDSLTYMPSLHSIKKNPKLIPKEEAVVIKGTAIVYCPVTMIRNIPTIINASISKDEISKAVSHFTEIIQEKNPELKKEEISDYIKNTGIDIYEQMGVMIVFDSDDFKEMSSPEEATKSFKNTNTHEWEWQLKPLHSTRKSIISFKFYYIDPANNKKEFILEKTINIAVRVDPRDYVDKWRDFLLDDPKNTTTVILVPIISFLGGYFSRRKNKKVE